MGDGESEQRFVVILGGAAAVVPSPSALPQRTRRRLEVEVDKNED